ncbi:tetratricopeptide repeat protein [Candidatus Poribacteria bacterium]|nr:tetratricopeptide repeat protein [Candidatus Poribacteria bacterium]
MAFIGGLIQRYEDEHFPKLTDIFPELKEDPPVKAASPNKKSTVTIWTETEIAIHAFFCIGGLFSEVRSHKKAISAYDMTLRLNPNFAEAYYNRGTAKTSVAQYEAAIADFDEAIRLKPKFVAAYYNRGLTKLTLDQSEAAGADLQIALKLAEQQKHDDIKTNIAQHLQELNASE